jgi:hypothetical protein
VTVREPHLFDDSLEILPPHEAVQGREGPDREKLEIAEHPIGELKMGELAGFLPECLATLSVDQEIHEGAPVGRD